MYSRGVTDGNELAEKLKIKRRDVRWLLEQSVAWLLREQSDLAETRKSESSFESLAAQLCTTFRCLQEVHIVPGGGTDSEAEDAALSSRRGLAAARYFDELAENADRLRKTLHVGVAGGESILDAVSQFPDRQRQNVHYYATALIGRGSLDNTSHVGPEINSTVAWSMSGRLPGHLHYGTVSPYDEELLRAEKIPHQRRFEIKAQLNGFADSPSIRKVVDKMSKINVAFAGLGIVKPVDPLCPSSRTGLGRLTMTGLLNNLGITPGDLAAEGAVGDISYCLFNAEGTDVPTDPAAGRPMSPEYWRFFLTAGHFLTPKGINFYKDLVEQGDLVIVIAGTHKERAIRAALKGKLFNVWFTDESAARALLSEA